MNLNSVMVLWISLGAGFTAWGQIVPPDELPVSGSCVVSTTSSPYQREKCELSTGNGPVPDGFQLTIQHVSAACSTTPNRGVYTLAIIARLSAEGPMRTVHIPVTAQAGTPDQIRLVGSHMVRIHAGSGTAVEALMSTFESAPPGHSGCDLTFSGVLKRVTQ